MLGSRFEATDLGQDCFVRFKMTLVMFLFVCLHPVLSERLFQALSVKTGLSDHCSGDKSIYSGIFREIKFIRLDKFGANLHQYYTLCPRLIKSKCQVSSIF